jgi:single-strand DNA-binding protein
MSFFNKVILIGNLTRDPETHNSPKGVTITQLSLALNRAWKNSETGEKKEEVLFVDVTLFGRNAEVVSEYCTKGKPLLVEGHLKQEIWEDKQSHQKRSKLIVIAETFQLLGGKPEEERNAKPASSKPEEEAKSPIDENHVPF